MTKIIILFFCVSFACFGSLQSASFECKFSVGPFGNLHGKYQCTVTNSVSITSLDEAEVDDITGTHQAGYNNDRVEGIYINRGQIHYFPRGINKIFKNLQGILIDSTGLKEIHQSDLKDFPNLVNLWLATNNLEILERNLFEFNPNLNYIVLDKNKISYIDPNVFDKLTKLITLNLNSNLCINMLAIDNPTAVQNVMRTAKIQCSNLDFLITTTSTQKPTTTTTAPTTTTTKAPKESEIIIVEKCAALESKINEIAGNLNYCVNHAVIGTNCNNLYLNEQCTSIKEDLMNQTKSLDTRMEILEQNVENFKLAALKEIQQIKNTVKDEHHCLKETVNTRADNSDKHIKKIEEKLAKMMRSLNIDD